MTALLHSRQAAYFYYSLLGAICSVLGYGVNMVWVSRQYVFQTYGATNFIPLYQGVLFERLQNAVGCLLMLFGYIPDRGVISLRGLITVTAFVLLGVFVFCGRRVYRSAGHREPDARFFATLFLAVSFALNFFVFVFTTSTMVPRYYITILMFALPVLAFYLEGEAPAFDKTAVCLILGACLALGTVKTVASFVTVDKNESKRPVAEFLAENDYTFGFATYTNANIITELTEGQVEIANVGDPEYLEYFKWSSPVRYYEEGYHSGETFLLLTAEETAAYEGARALQAGQIIYEDGNYVIYRYDSVEELMNCAKNR